MLCVLAIIGLLAAVALPSYSAHVRSSVMREGALSLMGLSLLQERFRLSLVATGTRPRSLTTDLCRRGWPVTMIYRCN